MYDRKRYHNDPVFRQKCIDSVIKWQRTHKKKVKARNKRYYDNHREERLAVSKEYQTVNKRKIKMKWKKKYDSDPVFRNKVKQRVYEWRKKNREKYNAYQRKLMKCQTT